jgi:CRISPR-associated protein Csm1
VVVLSEKKDPQGHLMAYAFEWLAEWSGHKGAPLPEGLPAGSRRHLEPYCMLLAGEWPSPNPGDPLLSIFSQVKDPQGETNVPGRYWPPGELDLQKIPKPQKDVKPDQATLKSLWHGFEKEVTQVLTQSLDADARFEVFTHLLHKWAWAVPCSYGEPGVSLYEEFRALSALVHASHCTTTPAGKFLLVGGDIPGIQDFVYTITSKGAAKGLRGRSFFIQLLGDAVVRRLLADLGLPETNVVYAAGGNFMLLAPIGAETQIEKVSRDINEKLLDAFEGDLALCLACQELDADRVGTEAFATDASQTLKNKIGRQKRRRFADIAEKDWAVVFGPQGQGGVDFCAVCQHEWRKGEKGKNLENGSWVCPRCVGFEELAQAIARDPLFMSVGQQRSSKNGADWQELLWELTGQWYNFDQDLKISASPGIRTYYINRLARLSEYVQGYRLIANTTPRGQYDQVRTFEDLADEAKGLKKVGVLRMDVDDLGRTLTRWLPARTMASTSTLSHALDRFFTGWLDAICREVVTDPQMQGIEKGRSDLLYVIYAGGDDLFGVGAWDLMPLLAARIRQWFTAYVGENPCLHISAGITLEDRKFPLYQAAKRAGDALDHGAKEMPKRVVNNQKVEKNAFCLLSKSVGWEDYPFVRELTGQLVELTAEQGVPRSLLTAMRAIHDRFYQDVERAKKQGLKDDKMYYGPWMWRKVYQLSRIRQRYDKKETQEIADAIEKLETEVLTKEQMPYVGLATRWAEYLTRGG